MATTVIAAGNSYELAAGYEEVVTVAAGGGVVTAVTVEGTRVAINTEAIAVIAEGTTTRRAAGFTANWDA